MAISKTFTGSAAVIALVASASAARAQEDPVQVNASAPPTAPTAGDSNGDDIVVTGIRQSLRNALDAKRRSDVVADIISAEDIGKFPDKNVAEALQRVPGIVINREFGEGERVSLRGTAPNLTRTLVNGHTIATADWFVLDQQAATRSFNYLTLPAEVVGQLDVYKSPEADVEEGGIGGTINVHTRNPLDFPSLTFSASVQGVYSDRSKKTDPQASGLLSWKNASETFGIVVGAIYQRRQIRRDGVEVLGYQPFTAGGVTADVPSLIGSALFKQDRVRYGGNIGLQFRPSDRLEVNVTGIYSRFNADNFNQNYLAWTSNALGGGGTLTNATASNGTFLKGTVTSTPGGRAVVFDAIDRKAFAETWSGDFDVNWKATDSSLLHVKLGYTEAHGDTDAQPFYEGGAPGSFTYDLTGRVPQVHFTGVDPTNPASLIFDFASLHHIANTDKEKYAYADWQQDVDWGPLNAIKIGLKYSDHDRIAQFLATTYGSFYLTAAGPTGCGNHACTSVDFAGGETPDDFLENIAEPGTLTQYFAVDRQKLEQILFGQPTAARARILNPPENFSINEKILGGYVMAKFGGDNWGGNAGVRVVQTKQKSAGNILGVPQGPGTINDNAFGIYQPIEVDRTYTDVLPSANVKLELSPKVVLRFAAARVMARPDYTDIVPRVSLNPGALSGDGGDPHVKPFRANQFDTSLEFYPDRDTIIAFALYYKDIQSYIVNTTRQEIFPIETNTPNLSRCTKAAGANPVLYDCLFDINRRSNGPGGSNKGFEIQVSRPLWAGFGVIANYTYSDAKANAGGAPIPGNSKHALNLTGYYEAGPASVRLSYNYRSTFFINIDRATELNQGATSSLDASASIKLTDNVSITADAINLTNDKIFQFAGTKDRFRALYDNGRQFYLGVRVRM